MAIVTRLSLIFADVVVIAATWTKTRGQVRDALDLGLGASTSTIMLKDGACTLGTAKPTSHYLVLTGSLYFVYVRVVSVPLQVLSAARRAILIGNSFTLVDDFWVSRHHCVFPP